MKACQAFSDFQSYVIVMLLCLLTLSIMGGLCMAWLLPGADRGWLPKSLRTPPRLMRGS